MPKQKQWQGEDSGSEGKVVELGAVDQAVTKNWNPFESMGSATATTGSNVLPNSNFSCSYMRILGVNT